MPELSAELEGVLAQRARQVDPEVQRSHARVYRAIETLRDEFRVDGLPVEVALAELCMQLLSVEYACRHRPSVLGKKLRDVPDAKERFLQLRTEELEERRTMNFTMKLQTRS